MVLLGVAVEREVPLSWRKVRRKAGDAHTRKTTVKALAAEQGDGSHCPHREQRCLQPTPCTHLQHKILSCCCCNKPGPSWHHCETKSRGRALNTFILTVLV